MVFSAMFTVGLLREAEDYDADNSLLTGKLEEMPKEQWSHLLIDFINPRDGFKVYFIINGKCFRSFNLPINLRIIFFHFKVSLIN